MSIVKSPYNNEKIALLRQLIVNGAESGHPIDYEIRVDAMKVVPRTNDPEQFDLHEDFVLEDTRFVTVIIYDGTSRRNIRHVFSLKEEKVENNNQMLSGIELEKKVGEKINQERQGWQMELVQKENENLKSQLNDAEEYIDQLEKSVQDMRSKRMKLGDIHWGEIASVALEGIVRRNTHLIAKIPGGEGLAGIIEHDNKAKEQPVLPQETYASFKRQESPETEKNDNDETVNQDEKERLEFLKQLQECFDDEQMSFLITFLNMLAQKPEALEPAILFVKQWKKDMPENNDEIKKEKEKEKTQEENQEEEND